MNIILYCNNIHIIYGLAENFGWDEYEHYVGEVDRVMKRPKADSFNIIRYLAIKSVHDVNNPDNIFFYYKHEPHGEWWDRAQKYIIPVKVEPPTEIFGNPVENYAHQADIIRLQILIEDGGIYIDSVSPFVPESTFDPDPPTCPYPTEKTVSALDDFGCVFVTLI